MKRLYFENKDSEVCYTENYFIRKMKERGIEKIDILEAVLDKADGFFWCREFMFVGDDSQGTCGKECHLYKPRNGKSGCCRHYTTNLYTPGEKITLVHIRKNTN